MRIKDLKQTCWACPSQWEAKTEDDQDVYIRYRWGCLTMDVDGQRVVDREDGDDMSGFMTEEQMCGLLDLVVLSHAAEE